MLIYGIMIRNVIRLIGDNISRYRLCNVCCMRDRYAEACSNTNRLTIVSFQYVSSLSFQQSTKEAKINK